MTKAQSLPVALDIIVHQVHHTMRVEVYSIYLVDSNTNKYISIANRGLNPDVINSASLNADEGVVSLVGHLAKPINLENVYIHPSFQYLKRKGEDRYHSFLGVPITIHHRQVLGVLVVQHKNKCRFSENERSLFNYFISSTCWSYCSYGYDYQFEC